MIPLMTSQDVCKYLNISMKTLQILRRQRKIRYLMFGHRTIRFREDAVLEFLRRKEKAEEFAENQP